MTRSLGGILGWGEGRLNIGGIIANATGVEKRWALCSLPLPLAGRGDRDCLATAQRLITCHDRTLHPRSIAGDGRFDRQPGAAQYARSGAAGRPARLYPLL